MWWAMARLLWHSVLCAAALTVAVSAPASAQRCPPNSHPEAVAIPGNLRTAQCFCDSGFVNLDGACVLPARPPEAPRRNEPAKTNIAPKPFR
jgi:hypothetical protein